jgi:hypothetical protein
MNFKKDLILNIDIVAWRTERQLEMNSNPDCNWMPRYNITM